MGKSFSKSLCHRVDIIGLWKNHEHSDTDRSMDGLVNIFLTQTMNELCRVADRECKNNCLPVPVRFILDDFATNCKIEEFPRMIASIRSRGISTMLMIQAEPQLTENYGYDGKTIIGNCDTYVYLGGNDIETAKAVAERCDMPVKKILNMPVGTNWIFRRGQSPVNGINFDPDTFEKNIIHSETER
ncbi:type IV secretory system conjugative DNA transfer family protein [Oribacterium sp. NK2B42]|uniref:type IV secretory system conjugative DNA transfer family protein n=1 Tax=Oribacterium sp. NK2B42 TaxID=689781 RepID=UPI0004198AD7|nr:TraG/TraD/VirD4 family protein [Oribacterium sp. NK2B42]